MTGGLYIPVSRFHCINFIGNYEPCHYLQCDDTVFGGSNDPGELAVAEVLLRKVRGHEDRDIFTSLKRVICARILLLSCKIHHIRCFQPVFLAA